MSLPRKPKLDPPAPSWKKDLSEPNETPEIDLCPLFMANPPNHVDDVWLEMARGTFLNRGLGVWVAITIFGLTWVPIILWVVTPGNNDFMLHLMGLGTVLAGLWCSLYFLRMDLEAPVDEPIRFNRPRRKIYVYRFHHAGLKPLSRTAWGVRPEVYDWDHVRAEYCSIYGPMGTGGLIESVYLAVVEPGTNKVIDRFLFAHGGQEGEMYWAMAQLFMQQGAQALPRFDRPPRDWNNEEQILNLARRFAPRVQWPAQMDLESRTAP